MPLQNLLSQPERRAAILKKWFDGIVSSYPKESSRFLKKKDPFGNPVGTTFSREIGTIYDGLVEGPESEGLAPCLDRIVRIKAVQDFSPSEALSFIFQLKGIIREELKEEIEEGRASADELWEMESRIDRLGLLAFEIYMACREKLYELRVNELHRKTYRLLQRANLVYNMDEEPGAGDQPG